MLVNILNVLLCCYVNYFDIAPFTIFSKINKYLLPHIVVCCCFILSNFILSIVSVPCAWKHLKLMITASFLAHVDTR